MKYNEIVERHAPRLGRKNLANGLSCQPFVYMEDSDDGMWVHYVTYCENIRRLKRALWMARAERAKERQNYESGCRSDGWIRRENMWLEVERLCRHKAEEYK